VQYFVFVVVNFGAASVGVLLFEKCQYPGSSGLFLRQIGSTLGEPAYWNIETAKN
jgi:hypothetical protein